MKNLENYPEVLTVDQMCEILQIGKLKAYELLRTHTIKCMRIGKKFIIPRASVEGFLDSIIRGIAVDLYGNEQD